MYNGFGQTHFYVITYVIRIKLGSNLMKLTVGLCPIKRVHHMVYASWLF